MVIVVAAKRPDTDSEVDPRFGRAAYFVIHDSETDGFQIIENNMNMQAAQGAGVQTARNIAERKVDWVIAGNFGPKAFQVLSAAGIKAAAWSEGTVAEAIELVRKSELTPINGANVEGHW